MSAPSADRSKRAGEGSEPELEELLLEPNGAFPNNPRLPVFLYRSALRLLAHGDGARVIERTFEQHAVRMLESPSTSDRAVVGGELIEARIGRVKDMLGERLGALTRCADASSRADVLRDGFELFDFAAM